MYTIYISVRAMQHVLDRAINTKISDDLVHELLLECYGVWPLVLWPLWGNFEKLAYPEKYS